MSSTPSNDQNDRYAWVDFAKGFCIVAVVALWVTHEFEARHLNDQITWLDRFVWFAYPFRMPDFFLISGLFLSRVIDRPWKNYLDTKVIHYLYFFLLWTFIIVPVMWLIGYHNTMQNIAPPQSWAEAVTQMTGKLLGQPFGMLWFVMFLSIYAMVVRLTRWVPKPVMFAIASLLMMFPAHTGLYHIDQFGIFFVFFYGGYMFAERFFALANWAKAHPRAAIALLLVWVVANKLAVQAGWAEIKPVLWVMSFIGISAVVMLSALVSTLRWAQWLTYLGKNSIAVYVGFYIPMVLIMDAMLRSPWGNRLGVVGAVVLVGSVAISIGAFALAKRLGLGFLYFRPSWARLVPAKPTRGARVDGTRLSQA